LGCVCLGACTLNPLNSSTSPLQVSLRESASSHLEGEAKNEARAMHHYIVGQLALHQGDVSEAVNHFTQASELHGKPIEVLNLPLAELLLRNGQLEAAKMEIKRALDSQPPAVDALVLHAGLSDVELGAPQAEEAYLRVLESDASRFEAYVLLAFHYERIGQRKKGIAVLEKLVGKFPQDANAHALLGSFYENEKLYSPAERSLREALALDGATSAYRIELIRVLIKSQKLAEARTHCELLLRQDPSNVLPQKILAQLKDKKAESNAFVQELLHYNSPAPSQVEAHLRAALYLLDRKNFDAGRLQLTLVLAFSPQHDQARFYLGSLLAGSGRRKEAVEELLSIGPEQDLYLKSRTFAAFVLRQDGELVAAEQATREALAVNPEDQSIQNYLVTLLKDQRKFSEALTLIENVLSRDSKNERMHFNYGILLSESGREEQARVAMEQVLQLNPQNAEALNFVAYSLAEAGINLDRAENLVRAALELRPADGYFLDTLGFIELRQGKLQQALDTLERAAQLVGDDVTILEHYADALVAAHEYAKAIDTYRTALEFARDSKSEDTKEIVERIEQKLDQLERVHSAGR
jgi:tetratricopeptide (TPR) repeat protein